jgi:uncharacterized protein
MERESFEDEEVARVMNERFVAIKVDREERPDVDSVYMTVCQLMEGQGGWPLNVFVTPDKKPFYAGTYFPKTSRYGRPGFIEVLEYLSDKFVNDREYVEDVAERATQGLKMQVEKSGSEETLTEEVLHRTFKQLSGNFDSIYGGFGAAPKFPIPHMLTFLLRYYRWTKNENTLRYVTKTLDGMANGGIYDHLGSGFARYSTDTKWLVPHFEKMLYDNALLLHAYTEAYQVMKDFRYQKIVEETVQFLKREMTSKEGAFYSAIDADSEGVEGKYYVWTKDEIEELLSQEEADLFCAVYNVTEEGNFEGATILNTIYTDFEQLASERGMTVPELQGTLDGLKDKLLKEREKRVYPHLDDKVLTSWNALMISALAKAGRVFGREEYVDLARKALQFIENTLIVEDRLMVRYRDGEVKEKGFLDEYAFLLWAYMDLYQATLDLDYVKKAKHLVGQMIELFWDDENGGFYFTASDHEELIVREKEVYDGALPSGNSVAVSQLLRLAQLTGDEILLDKAEIMLKAFQPEVSRYESGHTQFLQALLEREMSYQEMVILRSVDDQEVDDLINNLQKSYLPEIVFLAVDDPAALKEVAPFAADYKKIDNQSTVYICRNFSCDKPTANLHEVMEKLN